MSQRAGGVARRELGGGDGAWGEDGSGRGRGAVAFIYRQRSQGWREGDLVMTSLFNIVHSGCGSSVCHELAQVFFPNGKF